LQSYADFFLSHQNFPFFAINIFKMNKAGLLKECTFNFARSGGKGGQNVNKVSSKAELYFDVLSSRVLTNDEKQIVFKKVANKINAEGLLQITSETDRSQLGNKEKAQQKFLKAIEAALKPVIKRIKTEPSPVVNEKRIQAKKEVSEKKESRRRVRNSDK
jgi:ribosome-associated protein